MWSKKFFGLILLVATSLSLFACGNNEGNRESKNVVEEINNIKAVMEYEDEVSLNELGTVKYGKYPQSDENGEKKEDIEWIVIKKEDGKAYLLSKYILEHKQFEESGTDFEYKDSSLCKWLNEDFYNEAFEEDNLIVDYEGQKVSLAPTKKGFGSIYLNSINTVNTKYAGRYYKNIGNYEEQFNKILTIPNTSGISSNDTDRLYAIVEKYKNLFPADKTFYGRMNDDRKFVDDLEVFGYFVLSSDNKGYIKYFNEEGLSGGSGHLLKNFCGIRPMIVIKLDEVNSETSKVTKNKKKDTIKYSIGEIVKNIFTIDKFDNNASVDSLRSVKFGKYEGKDIEWVVFERDNNKALLMSKYNLGRIKFSEEFNNNKWETSDLRKYLNNEFYNSSFNNEEKKMIKETILSNGGYMLPFGFYNPEIDETCKWIDDNNTKDNVFVLSWNEIQNKFEDRTEKILGKNIKTYTDSGYEDWYWTRTSVSRESEEGFSPKTGEVITIGSEFRKNRVFWNIVGSNVGIRPCIYVEYNNVYKVDVGGDYNFYIDNVKQTNKWIDYLDDRYYLDENGYPIRNKFIDGVFVGSNGKMAKNTLLEDGSYIDFSGKVVNLENDLSDSIKEEQNEANAWYRTKSGIWYYFEKDRETKKKGWFDESRDNQRYYLDEITGVMATGWKNINGNMYYFSETSAKEPNWYYVEHSDSWESFGKDIKSLGSMYRNEMTPDGVMVDQEGRAYGDGLSNIMIDTSNTQTFNNSGESNNKEVDLNEEKETSLNNKNNSKYEDIYLEIKENKKTTIKKENEYMPTTINEAEAKFDEDGNLWITYYNYMSMMRDLIILYQDGTINDYTTYSPHGDEIFYEANVNGEHINENDKTKSLYEDMMNKYNNMIDAHNENKGNGKNISVNQKNEIIFNSNNDFNNYNIDFGEDKYDIYNKAINDFVIEVKENYKSTVEDSEQWLTLDKDEKNQTYTFNFWLNDFDNDKVKELIIYNQSIEYDDSQKVYKVYGIENGNLILYADYSCLDGKMFDPPHYRYCGKDVFNIYLNDGADTDNIYKHLKETKYIIHFVDMATGSGTIQIGDGEETFYPIKEDEDGKFIEPEEFIKTKKEYAEKFPFAALPTDNKIILSKNILIE